MNQSSEGRIKQALPWQSDLWSDWLRQLRAKRLPHAVLITGLAGLGKRHLAEAFTQAVLCRDEGDYKPCSRCKSCQLISAGSHPDLRSIEPEEPGKGIKIGQIRELVSFLSGTAQQGGWKCVTIEPADAMNNHAANALLKSLEEPPGDTLIVLVSSKPGRLAATLRSRCQQIQVSPPSREEALTWLTPRVGQRANELLDYAHGAPFAALAANDSDQLTSRTKIIAALLELAQAQGSAVDVAKTIQSHSGLEAIDQLLTLLNQIAKVQLATAVPPEPGEQWRAVIQRIDKRLVFRFRDKLAHAKSLLLSGANPNKQLLWEELMFDWQALTAARAGSKSTRPAL